MKAAWYEGFGAADAVLTVGEMPDPVPGTGEVLVRLHASGVNPSDVKLRSGARPGAVMAWPRVVPHSDGAGVIVDAGPGVDRSRIGQRVWIWNGQWQRAQGTAAALIALPQDQAVFLPDGTSFAQGAAFGIPAMTAWYALYADGPIAGKTVLVTGGAGSVGRYACQMAKLGGARVITTVSSDEKATHSTAAEWVNYKTQDVVQAVTDMTDGQGVDRIVEVDFAANQTASLGLIRNGGVIASYASASQMQPKLDFYPFMFKNAALKMLIVYLLDPQARLAGQAQLHEWLSAGQLTHATVPGGDLKDVAQAHQIVEAGQKLGTVVIDIA